MKSSTEKRIFSAIFVLLPIVLAALGGIGLIYSGLFFYRGSIPLATGVVSDRVNVPLDTISLGFAQFHLETQNFLLFQLFESLPPLSFPLESQIIGLSIWLLFSLGVILVSGFQRYPFIGGMVVAIFLLVLSGVNDLEISQLGQNSGLVISLLGLIFPAIVLHTFFPNSTLKLRSGIILAIAFVTWATLIQLSPVPAPTLLLSELGGLSALIISTIFILYIGHAVIGSCFVALSTLNQGIGLKITWHFTLLSIAYLSLIALLFLQAIGEIRTSFPLPPVYLIFIATGILGYFETSRKIRQIPQPYGLALIGKGIYLIGFAISSLVWFKAELTANAPMGDFLTHVFLYSQIGFGLLFFLYLISNFIGIMNTGTPVEKIMYRPPFFPYFHMRMGALLSFLVLAIFSDAVLLVQLHSTSINLSADYYQALGRNREAAILYEHAFDRYRNNPKNLNTLAHFYFNERQPTPGIQALIRSFDERPNVPDIILLTSKLQGTSKHSDALFYLEEGLKYFPRNPYLLNNLAYLKAKQLKPREALALWQEMDKKVDIRDANLQALYALHDLSWVDGELDKNPLGQVNRMANYNMVHQTAPFSLHTDSIRIPSSVNLAILRNQWSQAADTDYVQDIHQIDRILERELPPSVVAELMETKVIRNYQEGELNATLNNLGFLATNYTGSAGFFLSMQAKIFASQYDFNRAADAFLEAEKQGFSQVDEDVLAIIKLAGKGDEAQRLAEKYSVTFPAWMSLGEDTSTEPNDLMILAEGLAGLLTNTKEPAWEFLDRLNGAQRKADYAVQLLFRKSHWLESHEFETIGKVLKAAYPDKTADIESIIAFFRDDLPIPDNQALEWLPKIATDPVANAYMTPLVLRKTRETENDIDAYNLLHAATRLNRDPLLWIELVRYSRKIGQANYASSYLMEMSTWMEAEELIQLQINYLR
ncbi:hypothetical protein ADIS_3428 [Lunatimonas lonarensis]|uniref:TPR repeat protein n=1 Tax=Lunatimonas lonarensis TaxID=1232681 RepID=R7ZQB1_9BACT|nr:hypothetical protein [Lunatimonas lonarensis]EON76300.1 hypothetical protein ADIS_3428 [Lunatimonas lonarensis]